MAQWKRRRRQRQHCCRSHSKAVADQASAEEDEALESVVSTRVGKMLVASVGKVNGFRSRLGDAS